MTNRFDFEFLDVSVIFDTLPVDITNILRTAIENDSNYTKKEIVDISYITALSPIAYTSLVMSCSHFILQERGGASTARQYVKWGQGNLCIYNNSPNCELFNYFFNVEIIKFNDFMNLIYGIKNRNIDIISNAKK